MGLRDPQRNSLRSATGLRKLCPDEPFQWNHQSPLVEGSPEYQSGIYLPASVTSSPAKVGEDFVVSTIDGSIQKINPLLTPEKSGINQTNR